MAMYGHDDKRHAAMMRNKQAKKKASPRRMVGNARMKRAKNKKGGR